MGVHYCVPSGRAACSNEHNLIRNDFVAGVHYCVPSIFLGKFFSFFIVFFLMVEIIYFFLNLFHLILLLFIFEKYF